MDINAIKNVLERNREQPTIEEDALNSNLCPLCEWRLKVREDGKKSCPACGRMYD
jgi:predicted RNA-binding Zn-ribbon protein involved in translation (DUF1610 family)